MGNNLENYFFTNDTTDSLIRISAINTIDIKFPVNEYDECSLLVNGEKFIYFDRNKIIYLRDKRICGLSDITSYLRQVFNDMSYIISRNSLCDIRFQLEDNEYPTLFMKEKDSRIYVVPVEVYIMNKK